MVGIFPRNQVTQAKGGTMVLTPLWCSNMMILLTMVAIRMMMMTMTIYIMMMMMMMTPGQVLVVVDGPMVRYHGKGVRHYVLTLMHIVSPIIKFEEEKHL